MKKVVVFLCVLVCAAASVSAVEAYVEADFSVPILLDSHTQGSTTTKTTTVELAGGISGRAMFTDMIGIYGAVDIVFPVSSTTTTTTTTLIGPVKTTTSFKRADYNKWFGVAALIAPAIVPVNKGMFKLLIAPGLHINFLQSEKLSITKSLTYLGFGMNVMAEFHFSKQFYLGVGSGFFYDFYAFTTTKTAIGNTSDKGRTGMFVVQPRIGIGFHF